jgi:hypothetical protein
MALQMRTRDWASEAQAEAGIDVRPGPRQVEEPVVVKEAMRKSSRRLGKLMGGRHYKTESYPETPYARHSRIDFDTEILVGGSSRMRIGLQKQALCLSCRRLAGL